MQFSLSRLPHRKNRLISVNFRLDIRLETTIFAQCGKNDHTREYSVRLPLKNNPCVFSESCKRSPIQTARSKNHARNEIVIKSYPRLVNLVSRID